MTEITPQAVRVRYAPSPTGDPHIGNIRTALFDYLFAKHTGGKFILRIEDTDKAREVPNGITRIEESLRWLGLVWDEGPILKSTRLEKYQKIAQQLLEQGHAYYCFCTPERLAQVREQQIAAGKPAMYDKHCRAIDKKTAAERAKTEPHVIRLAVPETGETAFTDFLRGEISFQNSTIDDQVLLKSDGYPTYHLAVVVDDHDMQISHILRGDEWISSTPKHVLLYQFLNWPMPIFVHLPLIIGQDKKKLSKRTGDTSLLSYQEQGYRPEAILNFLVRLGFSPKEDRKLYTLDELVQEFALENLHKNPAIFDQEKLHWFNRLVKEQSGEHGKLEETIASLLQDKKVIGNPMTDTEFTFVKEAAKRIDTTRDIEPSLSYLWQTPDLAASNVTNDFIESLLVVVELDLVDQLTSAIEKIEHWDQQSIGNVVRDFAKNQPEIKNKIFYQFLTFALSGSLNTPPVFASMALIGKDEVIGRLKSADQFLRSDRNAWRVAQSD